jgi:hypothetical protein
MTLVRTRVLRLMPLLAVMIVAAGVQTSPVSAATCVGKCALGTLSTGTGSQLSFTLRNDASPQSLGSADLLAPAGVVIGQPGPITTTGFTNTSATATLVANTLVLRNLSIPPGDSITVRFAACGSSSSSTWALVAKQANNFNGSPGNDFIVEPASVLTASATSCTLSFVDQPANALANAAITSMGFQAGSPVEVKAGDSNGDPIAGVTVNVSLLSPGGVAASLAGATTSVSDANGLAAFTSLSVDRPGYFNLHATANGFAPQDSSVFLIAQVACRTSVCTSESLSTKSTGATVTLVSPSSLDILSAGLGGYTYDCAGYASVTDPLGFDVWTADGRTFDPAASSQVTLDISKQTVTISPNNGAPFYQICYASSVSFPTRTGTAVQTTIPGSTTPFFVGLLPDCSSSIPAPCVVSRHKGPSGDVLISFLAAPGDIWGRS